MSAHADATNLTLLPHPHPDPIVGTPTYASIRALHNTLNANAASHTSTLGDGKLGLLGLNLSAVAYQALSDSNVAFDIPTKPKDPTIPTSTTAHNMPNSIKSTK